MYVKRDICIIYIYMYRYILCIYTHIRIQYSYMNLGRVAHFEGPGGFGIS